MLANNRVSLLLLAAVLAIFGATALAMRPDPERPALGLFTTLPIYWSESADIAGYLDGAAQPHWARTLIEQDFTISPLDALVAGDATAPDPLSGLAGLVIAQPRTLSPAENVALDQWVRDGGHLLLFADPMLTAHSEFGIGDKRRPQDVVLLSPLLAHWGLRLEFDEAQSLEERIVTADGIGIPIQLAGRFAADPSGQGGAQCRLAGERLMALCAIGKGRATILADAHLLDGESPVSDSGGHVLRALLEAGISR